MDFRKNLFKVPHRHFEVEFKINKFKEFPVTIPEDRLLVGVRSGIYISLRGKGERPENKDFIVFRIEESFGVTFMKLSKSDPPNFVCTCILSILDVEGHKRFPRTFTIVNDSVNSDVCEERYIQRSIILNDASEYLREDTISVTVEGTIQQWFQYVPLRMVWYDRRNIENFNVEQHENALKVYLRDCCEHESYLREHSKVFQDMWSVGMSEKEENCILLKNEELPAFLCMLFFIETQNLVLYEATIFDLYKIADKYDIPILLGECRKFIAEYLPKNASAILEFATYYYDTELKKTAESYIEKHSRDTRESNDNLESGDESVDDFVCDMRPVCSSLINTKADFEKLLRNLCEHFYRHATDQAQVLGREEE